MEDCPRERGKLRIARESQRDQLVDGEFADARLQIFGPQSFATQALFEADYTILNSQRKDPCQEGQHEKCHGQNDTEDPRKNKIRSVSSNI
jgi:hypothetical protein